MFKVLSFPTKFSFRDSVDNNSLIELVRVMILSRIDYSNSFLRTNCLSWTEMTGLMNSAWRLLFRLLPETPALSYVKRIHWLPLKQCSTKSLILLSLGRLCTKCFRMSRLVDFQKWQRYEKSIQFSSSHHKEEGASHAISQEWFKLTSDLNLIPHELIHRKKLITFSLNGFWVFKC